jgi:hypothetical protein
MTVGSLDDRVGEPRGCRHALAARTPVAEHDQRHDLVSQERPEHLEGQPGGKQSPSELLESLAREQKQYLVAKQQDRERPGEHPHAYLLARRDLDGKRAIECGGACGEFHRRGG